MTNMNESHQQIEFVKWFRETYPTVQIWHIPSGSIMGGRNKFGLINQLKSMGWVNGIPDLFIPAWSVWIEFKTEKGKVSSGQQEKLNYLESCGYSVFVAYGVEQAKSIILDLNTVNLRYSLGK